MNHARAALLNLNAQDVEVLAHITLSGHEACRALSKRPSTLRTAYERIFASLHVRSKTQAIVVAMRLGIVEAGDFVMPANLDLEGFDFDKFSDTEEN